MPNPQYTYLLLNVGTLLFPFLLSFDRKVAFFRSWKALFPAIAITGAVFIAWDVYFTETGIWRFNPEYLIGVYLFNLPLEEWLFFLTVPYACVFIYACLLAYFPKDWLAPVARYITWGLMAVLVTTAIVFFDRMYTAVTFLGLAAWFLVVTKAGKAPFMGRFYLTYIIHLLPFFVINGVLTAMPVLIYNDQENLGIRLGTVPLEDTMYSMLLLIMNISLFVFFQTRFRKAEVKRPKRYVQPEGNH